MKYAIDETELARLVAKACRRPKPTTFDELRNAVPALVAEVRRLRKSLQRHEHMVAELMEKVEAWEWFEECFEVMQWLVPMGPNLADACEEAVISTLDAQKRAAHADRE